jgi:hypothetical protein
MVESIASVLMERDGMTQEEADKEIEMARKAMYERIAEGEMPHDICNEWFGLEPDYLEELI